MDIIKVIESLEDNLSEFDGSKSDNSYLFEGLKIMNEGEECLKHM